MNHIHLRPHQEEGFQKIIHSKKSLLKMFCGSGKTRLAFKTIVCFEKDLSVIVFPNIGLIDQFNMDYLLNPQWKSTLTTFVMLSVCSKKEFHVENHIPYVTQPKLIREFLENTQPKIICITYQSFPTLFEIGPPIDYIIFDEAHHVIGDKIQQLIFHPSFGPTQVLFMTATPKNQNGVIMVDEGDNKSMCGPIAYSYTHFQGVKDEILNGFQIMVDLFVESTSTGESSAPVLESICRAVLQTGNNRVLTFHSRTETEHSTRTNVLDFVDEKKMKAAFHKVLTAEFPLLKTKYRRVHFKGITANTKNKRHVLEQFDQCPDNEIFVLSSCKTINEGIDTKNANMCVFVDPKNSHSDIIQNIGRITRLPRPDIPFATVLIPVGVDASKYSSSQTQEERDVVIREDMNQGGNFSSILNVVAALKHDDEELYDMCLNYPHSFSPEEMEENFLEQGYEIEREDEEDEGMGLGQVLEDLLEEDLQDYDLEAATDSDSGTESNSDSESGTESNSDSESGTEESECNSRDQILQTIAEDHDATIRIHTHCIDNPIQVFGDSADRVLNIYENENGGYHALKPQNDRKVSKLKAPRRQKLMSVHTNSDIQLLWNIAGGMDLTKEVCSVVLDCEVVREDPMERAIAIVERCKERERNGGKLLPRQIHNKNSRTTEELIQEYKDAQKLCGWKQALKGSKNCVCSSSVRDYLDQNLLNWRLEINFDENALQDAQKIVERALQRVKNGKILLPKFHTTTSNSIMTEELMQENKDVRKLSIWKQALKGKSIRRYRCSDEVRDFLDEKLPDWRLETNFDEKALQDAKEIVERALQRRNGGGKLLPRFIHNKNSRTTEELNQEYKDAIKLGKWKKVLKGNSKGICSGEVRDFLDEKLPNWRLETDFDEKALQDAREIVERALQRRNSGGRLLPRFIHKNSRTTEELNQETKDATKLGNWKQALKGKPDQRCSNEVRDFLDEKLPDWRLETDFDEKAIQDAQKIVERALQRLNNGGSLLPRFLHNKNSRMTEELMQENKDVRKLSIWKQALKGKANIRCSDEVRDYLDTNLPDWRLEIDFDEKALIDAKEIVERALQRKNNGGKLLPRQIHNKNSRTTEELNQEDKDAAKLGGWKTALKGKNDQRCSNEVRDFLDEKLPNWRLETDEKTLQDAQEIVQRALQRENNGGKLLPRQIHNKNSRTTEELNQEDKDATKLGVWKQALKGKGRSKCSDEVRNYLDTNLPSWRDEKKKKSMEKAPQPNPVKTPQEKRKQRIQSELSTLHQKYKTMNSANLHKTFQEDPSLWHVYHQISEQNEQSFPEDEIPYRRIIQYLETLRQHSAVVADLGCGKAKIHQHFALTNKFQFHNFDHVACHDSVVSRDISHTELPDASVDIVILCLAMWGSNCEAYLEEAYRILDKGGRLLIMEPTKRWIEEETGKNRLEEWLQKRFTLAKKEERKFMFLEAFKII